MSFGLVVMGRKNVTVVPVHCTSPDLVYFVVLSEHYFVHFGGGEAKRLELALLPTDGSGITLRM
jgi:hypothetical protein